MTVLAAAPDLLWQRVLARTTITADCWLWTGATNSKGYGQIGAGFKSRNVLVHRLAVIVRDGSIVPGLTVDHTCHNADPDCPGGPTCRHRVCVRPEHLDPVPIRTNVNRAGHGSETHCLRGHRLAGSNLVVHTHGSRPATRGCRACRELRDFNRPR